MAQVASEQVEADQQAPTSAPIQPGVRVVHPRPDGDVAGRHGRHAASRGDATLGMLEFYDNLMCLIFLVDFAMRLRGSRPLSQYFIKERGWLDLLGSIPSLGVAFRYTGLFRLARLSRLTRILRLMRGAQRKDLVTRRAREPRASTRSSSPSCRRSLVLATASVLVLQFETRNAESHIKTGGDAFWYSVVTLTTVGYGDYYPVTVAGRVAADVHHVRRRGDHRRPRQHPRQRARRRWRRRCCRRRRRPDGDDTDPDRTRRCRAMLERIESRNPAPD